MSLAIDDLLEGLRNSREYVLKHLAGMTDEQLAWKPYPECKSVLETLAHLYIDDKTALHSLKTACGPNYEDLQWAYGETEKGKDHLLGMIKESHDELLIFLRENYIGQPLDTPICVWGTSMPLMTGVPYLSSEDYYHAGQIAFIRMATDPGWDYYADIYPGL